MKLKRYLLIKLDKLTVFHKILYTKESFYKWFKIRFRIIVSWKFPLFDINLSYSLYTKSTWILIDFIRFRLSFEFEYMRHGQDNLPF